MIIIIPDNFGMQMQLIQFGRQNKIKMIFGFLNRKIFELVIWVNDPSIEWGLFKERWEHVEKMCDNNHPKQFWTTNIT